ncbi:MAG: hypothetical protein R6X05_10745 [Desulfobacterales bacterium]
MKWQQRVALLTLAAVPALSGYPLAAAPGEILPGLTWGWGAYFCGVHLLLVLTTPKRLYGNILSASALISLPVVFGGAALSGLMHLTGLGHPGGPRSYSPHYLALLTSMLTVIPLGLALVASIPFQILEQQVLTGENGISRAEKNLLMALRVFNHIVHDVIPATLEVVREEWPRGPGAGQDRRRPAPADLIRMMTWLGIAGICCAVQYIPLWAVEIARLPERRPGRLGGRTTTPNT